MTVLEAGHVIAGRYRLDRALARGGMGCVWMGHHLQLDVGVAVKLMAPELAASADARARFEREAKACAQLRIPNVVQIYDFGIEDDTPFLVMELLEGEDLETRLDREGRLDKPATKVVLDQVCRGLRRAHDAGVVHRDLKPANVFLSRQGGEETVKILDFGIAKATGPASGAKATGTGALLGSPHYMSPEQVRNTSTVDLRTDLWAVGVIVFRCLTGELPFPGDQIGEVLVDVCTAPIPLASQLAGDLGPDVDRFFERALSRDLAARFQSAAELAEAFAVLAGEAPALSASAPATTVASSRQPSAATTEAAPATQVALSATLASPVAEGAARNEAPAPDVAVVSMAAVSTVAAASTPGVLATTAQPGPSRARAARLIVAALALVLVSAAALRMIMTRADLPSMSCNGITRDRDATGSRYVFPLECRPDYLEAERYYESSAIELAYVTDELTNALVDDPAYISVLAREKLGKTHASADLTRRVVEKMKQRADTLRAAIEARGIPVLVAFKEGALEVELGHAADVRDKRLIIGKYKYLLSIAASRPEQITVVQFPDSEENRNLSFAFIKTPGDEVVATAHQAQDGPMGPSTQIVTSRTSEVSWFKERMSHLRGSRSRAERERALQKLLRRAREAEAAYGSEADAGQPDAH
jgi:eukaryotic-like serine/threonine-protein kinase